ncbi:MAG TPA: hypothetical protein VN737_04390 [Bryobacteraceae bacterium]|nr:hypothetical protein [Bryobacteraceae bacterium]
MTPPLSPAAAREQVLIIIKARGAASPASIAYLQSRTGVSERTIKGIVEQARVEGLPICASRKKPCGYFLAATAEELEASAATMRSQAMRMLVAAGRLVGKHRIREMLGQMTAELNEEIK